MRNLSVASRHSAEGLPKRRALSCGAGEGASRFSGGAISWWASFRRSSPFEWNARCDFNAELETKMSEKYSIVKTKLLGNPCNVFPSLSFMLVAVM